MTLLRIDMKTKVVQHDNYHDDYYDYHDNYHDDYHNENHDYRDDYHDVCQVVRLSGCQVVRLSSLIVGTVLKSSMLTL